MFQYVNTTYIILHQENMGGLSMVNQQSQEHILIVIIKEEKFLQHLHIAAT